MSQDELFNALKEKNIEKIKTLLQVVDINAHDKKNLTPLHFACDLNLEPIATLLLDNPQLNLERYFLLSENDSPIHLATKNKNKKVVQKFLEKKPKFINLANKNGNTILHLAVGLNDIEMVKMLLTYEALEIDKKTDSLFTSLHIAVLNEDFEIANLLLKHGANIHEPMLNNSTMLMFALNQIRIKEKSIDYLLQFPIDLNYQNKNQTTALHIACANGQVQSAIKLIEHGASLELKDEDNQTPLDLASEQEKCKIILEKYLLEKTLPPVENNPKTFKI